jgi:integrase
MNAPDKKAAAIVKHRGVTVAIYGPLADRKREVYLLAYYVGSRREKETIKGTLEDARRKAKEKANGLSNGEICDALHLSPLDRRVYLSAKEVCAPTGRAVDSVCREWAEAMRLLGRATLRDAAKFWAAHHARGLRRATVAEVVAALYLQLETKRRAGVTVAGLKTILDRFAKAFQVAIGDVQTHEIERWLSSQQLGPRTLNNYRAAVLRLFNFARGEFLDKERPTAAHGIARVTEERTGAVEIFRPWELAALLSHASEDLVPCIAIGAFAGARTVELTRMEWSAVHFEPSETYKHGYIEVAKSVAKQHRTASRRIVPIQANLARWLAPYASKVGPISPFQNETSLSRAITRLTDRVNVKEKKLRKREIARPKNGLRHSYGSYRLPVLKSAAALAIEMNNSEQEVWRDYHELAPPKDVEAYWRIEPSAQILLFEMA